MAANQHTRKASATVTATGSDNCTSWRTVEEFDDHLRTTEAAVGSSGRRQRPGPSQTRKRGSGESRGHRAQCRRRHRILRSPHPERHRRHEKRLGSGGPGIRRQSQCAEGTKRPRRSAMLPGRSAGWAQSAGDKIGVVCRLFSRRAAVCLALWVTTPSSWALSD